MTTPQQQQAATIKKSLIVRQEASRVCDHFADVGKMVASGSGDHRPVTRQPMKNHFPDVRKMVVQRANGPFHNSPVRRAGLRNQNPMRAEGPRHYTVQNDAGLQPAWCFTTNTQSCGLGYYEAGPLALSNHRNQRGCPKKNHFVDVNKMVGIDVENNPFFVGHKHVGTIRKFRIVHQEGQRQIARALDFLNLDTIISVVKKSFTTAADARVVCQNQLLRNPEWFTRNAAKSWRFNNAC